MAEKEKPKVNIRFLFNFANDLAKMRNFYGELLGMQEVDYSEEYGYLMYQCEGLQVVFFKPKKEVAVLEEWADQPGYEGGELAVSSIAVEIPQKAYPEVLNCLRQAGVKMLKDKPEWRMDSYWGLSVMDPMGTTLEVYTTPKEKPDEKEWEG